MDSGILHSIIYQLQEERDINIIIDLLYIIGAIIAAGVVVAMLSTKF